MLLLLSALLISPGHTQPKDSARVQAGDDIEAWRALQSTGQPSDASLRAFVLEFPSSPLSELAYGELMDRGASPPDLPAIMLTRLEASHDHHQQALARTPSRVAAATMELGEVDTPRFWSSASGVGLSPKLELGAMGTNGGAGAYVGAAMSWRSYALGVRGTLSAPIYDLSIYSSARLRQVGLTPYLEFGAYLMEPAGALALGLSHPLDHGFGLNVAAEARMSADGVTPLLRMGLGKGF